MGGVRVESAVANGEAGEGVRLQVMYQRRERLG